MKLNSDALREGFLRMMARFRGNRLLESHADDEAPLRSELLSIDQMRQHGKALAHSHQLSPAPDSNQLLTRLDENERILIGACDLVTTAVNAKRQIAPAGEWLLDNFYLIEEQIRTARRHFPKGYSRELPRLLNGPSVGLPRVYNIALEIISHGDGRIDPENLSSFVAAYQTVTALKLGELWAIPIMLRLALIENLRRIGTRIAAVRTNQDRAANWSDQMLEIVEKEPKSLVLVMADMARSNPPLVSSFVAEFTRRLQGQSPSLTLPLTWVEQRLSESGLTVEQLVQAENRQQAADQVSISNSIGSLRSLGATDWRDFVEKMSVVEQVLREDPGGFYSKMDFATRDRYRHVVEKIAKKSDWSEEQVARKAIDMAREGGAGKNGDGRAGHVGYYLIDRGLLELEQTAELRRSSVDRLQKMISRFPLLLYLTTITLMSATFTGCLLAKLHAGGVEGWILVPMGCLLLLCTSHLVVPLVNWLATLLSAPHLLPRLDFSGGIPLESRTLVVIPTMLTSIRNVEDLVESLEVRFLANRSENLHFALLTDFRDAREETLPEDEPLLRRSRERIEELNQKYSDSKNDTFFLFHRSRRWNPQEATWMGYERKRGKLADLNSLLLGGVLGTPEERFSVIVGRTEILSSVKYVITLDTDTQLPRDSAWQFVGAMAHPLNHPHYDGEKDRVCEGYGILQPRVAVSLPGTNRSRFARLFGSEPGIDPYTRAVSDVYQDLFHEGSFIGKGIYEVDAFDKALRDRFPENRILSHDLVEGCYARAGLLSDVQLYEEYPSNYSADVNRRHRWIRGDWQIVRWLLPAVPGRGTSRQRNPLSGLSRWKIFDNLRRSLVPSALLVLFFLGWTALEPKWLWTLVVLGILLLQPCVAALVELFRKPKDLLMSQHFVFTMQSLGRHVAQVLFTLSCLSYEAFYTLDAIVRTAWRIWFTHRHLLEWNPASHSDHPHGTDLLYYWRAMWIAPVLAVVSVIYLAFFMPHAIGVASPFLCLWFLSPAIAWWISRPIPAPVIRLTSDQTLFLRKLSRKTWAFYETFVGPKDHWLPPDNFQEHPVDIIGHRTSPTNMGLALLANLSAYDFGYIQAGELIDRTANAFQTMESLERSRGHFFNWYDTESLKPLHPKYISTVDSGNLAGHLLTLRSGLSSLPDQKILGMRWLEGISDTLMVLIDLTGREERPAPGPLGQFQKDLAAAWDSRPTKLVPTWKCLDRLAVSAAKVADSIDADPRLNDEVKGWARALARQSRVAVDELAFLTPWILLPPPPTRLSDLPGMDEIPSLRQLAGLDVRLLPEIDGRFGPELTSGERDGLNEIRRSVTESSQRARSRISAIKHLALQSGEFAQMEYGFLFDRASHLLTIGYNASERHRDSSFYDLLASEARVSAFVGIAQGQLPQESWFSLGRLLTTISGEPVLLSWSGSMFEYLMPLLVMPTYENTLLDRTYKAAVNGQIAYGRKRGVPWGMSESCYNTIDIRLNYQYRAFGVPGLGLKRGLADDLVVAPYASALALMVAPDEACLNLQRLAAEGAEGRYGLYEAIDYTPSRVPRGQTKAIVRSFMAHHQGMSFLSLAYLLLDRPMQKRFESDPSFQATILLLQERVPKVSAFWHATEHSEIRTAVSGPETRVRVFNTPHTPIPEVQLLSNGRYHVMITNSGGGYSRWKNLAVTRWREDTTCDHWGTFCYIRDVKSGEFWSTAYQPTLKRSENYETIFSEARAEFRCRNHDFDTHTQIAVSPEDDVELRQVTLTSRAPVRRTIDVTSYSEVVLAPPPSDALHPAFSNLFVQTEILQANRAILCTRRPRSREEQPPWMFHLMGVHGAEVGEISYETDRRRFIGRGNTIVNPAAMRGASDISGALSGSEGSVLDPIVAIRCRMTLDPGESATINMVSGVGDSRLLCMSLVEKYQDRRLADRVFDLAWTHGRVLLQQINATEADAQLYTHLAASVLYANSSLRADAGTLAKNRRGQSGLWGYSISGDLPIVLLRIGDQANIELVRQLVQAHAYWRLKGLAVDLVIWNEDYAGYRQLLHEQIMGLIAGGLEANLIDRPGGIFVRATDQISNEDRFLLQSVARCIITDGRGTLWDQVHRRRLPEVLVPHLQPTRARQHEPPAVAALPRRDLIFFNGLGGFTPDGREYVISTAEGQTTPAPWVNVLANPCFGTVLSESGAAYTWNENAHEFRLTPWVNDPVSDLSGEAFYIRDDERGDFWSPTPLPSGGATPYASRHGFGYSVFEHMERGIRSELWVYVAMDEPIKFAVLKIRNESGRYRRLSATGYVEWILGDLRSKWAMHVITELEAGSGAFFARNRYNTEFADRIAFFDVDDAVRSVTGDRTEFLGRNGTLQSPAAMTRAWLSGRVGSALDPCAAIQIPFELADGQEREIVFRLGVGRDASDAINMISRFRGSAAARGVLESVWQYWKHTLGAVQVETPDPSLNLLANGWLLYQTLACRLWARNGFYQPGGAFGFRDQLQDVMALIHAEPQLAREHLLLCATRQFREGDVQHWWHPPSGRGVRTHCSDDYLWLPLATSRYVVNSGDRRILDESVPFLEGRPVHADEDSYYDLPDISEESASLYEHCVRAIHRGLRFGEHGLPLIGSGDWNDGMNRVGELGKGESVWLGFFLYEVLMRFKNIARIHGDLPFARRCEDEAARVRQNIEQYAWDGEWYLRAYFDDGSPLGSAMNLECQIDSIAQSWSVLSGAADPERARRAMQSLDARLVRREHQLIQLLAPPFDKSDLNPGYIKGYVPGVRENGGQYTQGAIWAAMAFASLGDSERAWELLTMINPVNHSGSPEAIAVYKVEPYVVSADVYALRPHTGSGGWTWYTGSAGWTYRLILESLLGLRLEAGKLRFAPCLPADWERVRVHYRYRETVFHIMVQKAHGVDGETLLTVDGNKQQEKAIILVDDRKEHMVEVRIPFGTCESERSPRVSPIGIQTDS